MGGPGDRDDVLGRLDQRDIQKGRQTAAGSNLSPRPIRIDGLGLLGVQAEEIEIDVPDRRLLPNAGEVQEPNPVEALAP